MLIDVSAIHIIYVHITYFHHQLFRFENCSNLSSVTYGKFLLKLFTHELVAYLDQLAMLFSE